LARIQYHFRYHAAAYDIAVENPRRVNRGVMLIELDGKTLIAHEDIPLLDDGAEHRSALNWDDEQGSAVPALGRSSNVDRRSGTGGV
jgi:hypothetical protein